MGTLPEPTPFSCVTRHVGVAFGSGEAIQSVPVHFLHIRKTGGTAIIEALQPLASRFGLVLHDHATKLSDVPFEHRVVFFVRHPISRFVSGFYSRLRRGLPRHHYPWSEAEAEAFRHFQTANDLGEALSSMNNDIRDRATKAMKGISHIKNTYQDWFSGTQELDDRKNSIALLGLQEELNADFERLKKILNLPETVRLPYDDMLAHRTPPDFDQRISPLAKRNLSKWFLDDLQFYEYCLKIRAAKGS